jgi:hypothetical protein
MCIGEVGAVFGLEVSRFGRSNADRTRLMELARLTDTQLVDVDGMYDLANVNDRILIGLKGQMSAPAAVVPHPKRWNSSDATAPPTPAPRSRRCSTTPD